MAPPTNDKERRTTRATKPAAANKRKKNANDEVDATWTDIPDKVRRKLQRLEALVRKQAAKREEEDEDDDDDDGTVIEQLSKIQEILQNDLDLSYIGDGEIQDACCNAKNGGLSGLIQTKREQTQRAHLVFDLLDGESGKGVVVLQDLQRVAADLFPPSGSAGNVLTDDDLEDMMNEFVDNSNGDGLLTRDDLVRIARKVGL